ncbi:serine/threonine-protein kinase fray2-like isoform X2 [Dreissena polymorpha]|uniref:serine/threonine-protein kinase fray2-like isoform X2 n=1 Tax=Dreissena polymorpha TaxID=45954 RepID=UPI002263EF87|nr:serine/threonine-protein kinase fray2-like isoform X2 [Dreissena polymorpha]
MFTEDNIMSVCLMSVALLLGTISIHGEEFNANMEDTAVCTILEPRTVRQVDVYNIFAQPSQLTMGTRDRCTLKFLGEGGRKFKFFMRDLQFMECGTEIRIYQDWALNNPWQRFGCNSPWGEVFTSFSDKVAVSLEKADARATGYKFYIRVATEDGPDISVPGPKGGAVGQTMSAGVTAGIVVACLLVSIVIVAVVVYCVIVRRNKDEAHMAKAHSMKNLLTSSSKSNTGGSSVHSSVHNSVHSSKPSTAFTYPSFHSTITAKHAACNSIETKSHDSVDTGPPKPIKSVKHEFDTMKKGLERDSVREAREQEKDRAWRQAQAEAQHMDRQSRNEPSRGLGRSNRNPSGLTNTNIKNSLRQARDKGRSLSDRNVNRSSTRSRSTHKSRHRDDRDDDRSERAYSDFTGSYSYKYNENADRSRNRTKSTSSQRGQRSASSGSMSRRHRDYYDDYDNYSDYDDRRRGERHDSVGRKSGTQRSRSHSQSNGRRPRQSS